MKVSLRAQKIRTITYRIRKNHNRRATLSETVVSERTIYNKHYSSEHDEETLDELWNAIRKDFDQKKEDGLLDAKKRFLKKTSTKSTKDKNGKKKTEQIETSIVREFVLQVGKEQDHLGAEKSFEIYTKAIKHIEDKYKLTLLNYDFHADETTPHIHAMLSTYDFRTGEFSKEFNKAGSYEKMQTEVKNYIQELVDVELEDRKKKEGCEADYIPPVVYRRNKELLDKAREYCNEKDEAEDTINKLSAAIDEIQEIIGTDTIELSEVVKAVGELKDEAEQKEKIIQEQKKEISYLRSMHSRHTKDSEIEDEFDTEFKDVKNRLNKAREAILNENEGKSSPKAFTNEYEHLYSEIPETDTDTQTAQKKHRR